MHDDKAYDTHTLDSNVTTTSADKQSWPCPLFLMSDSGTSTDENKTSEPYNSDHSDDGKRRCVVQN